MPVELGSGYVALTVSARGIKQDIERELKPLEASAAKTGDRAGSGFAASFKDNASKGIAAAGAGLSLALGKGFADNLSIEKANDKLAAQLGLTGKQAKDAGQAAGDLYGAAYGDSLATVNDAIKGVQQNIDGFRGASEKDLEGITKKVLSVAEAFDQDLNATTAAAGQLMKTGLAKNADEAFDIITIGFQNGIDKSGDFLDTITEYGTQFRKLGIDGKTATGILSQGLKAGARDADIVADALKEFSIRAVDGSKITAKGFEQIGLSAEQMAAAVAGGGPSAANALQVTLDKLRQIKDPALQAQAAVALFGTQAEDLGAALFAIDPSKAVTGLGEVTGAAQRLDTQLNSNTATTLETFKRQFSLAFSGLAEKVGPVFGPVVALAPAMGGLAQASDKVGPALKRAAVSAATAAKGFGLMRTALVAGGVGAAVAFVGNAFLVAADRAERMKREVDALTSGLKTNDLKSYEKALADMRARLDAITAKKPGGVTSGFLGDVRRALEQVVGESGPDTLVDYKQALDAVKGAMDKTREATDRLNSNTAYFRKLLGLTDAEVAKLAETAGVDLSNALDSNMVVALQKARGELTGAAINSKDLAEAQGLLGSKVTTAAEKLEALETALDSTLGAHIDALDATSNLEEANNDLASAYADTGDEAAIAAGKLDAFKTALDRTLGIQLSAYDAATALAAANERLAEAFQEAKGTADPKSKEGRGLRDALSAQIEATEADIAAMVESGQITAEQGTALFIKRLEELKKKYPALAGSVEGFLVKLRQTPKVFADIVAKTDLAGAAQGNLTAALAAEVKAFDAQQRALITAGGLTADVGARVNDYVAHLEGLKKKYPELAPVIDGFIAKVREIPASPEVKPKVEPKPALDGVAALKAKIVPDLKALSVTFTPQLDPKPALDAAVQLRSQIVADFGSVGIPLTPTTFPGRAAGGPVRAGESYIVGERQAEVLTMGRMGGYITPEVPGSSSTASPLIGSVQVDARGIPQVERLAEYVGVHVDWRIGPSGRL